MDVKTKLLVMKLESIEEEKNNQNIIDIEKLKQDKIEYQKTHPDIKPDCLISGWIIYIFIMIAGLIFVDYIFLAIAATIIFFKWKHNKIEEANGRKYED